MNPIERFESYVERVPESGCWIFLGNDLNQFGHARFSEDGKRVGAHRYSYEKNIGPVGDNHVLHRCDVPCCVNPHHLFLGTQADNMKDKAAKSRCSDRNNEKHPLCKLSNSQVAEIRSLRSAGWKQQDLADKFGISQDHVSRIVNHKLRKGI
jgi:hypothetical protein